VAPGLVFFLSRCRSCFTLTVRMYECVAQTVVGMLREVIDSEHEVFVFKLVIFLLATLEKGKRENVMRFTHAGGAAVLASLMVISADKVPFFASPLCQDEKFGAWQPKTLLH
jgi:hypothetical protein